MRDNLSAVIKAAFTRRYPQRVVTVDSHTAGEPTRLVVDGIGPLSGGTMSERAADFSRRFDDVRLRLTREPRGHRGIMAAVLTDPVTEAGRFGLFYMDARRYPHLCGHATIGAVTTLVELSVIRLGDGEHALVIDTPSGPVNARCRVKDGRVLAVATQMVPSFVLATDQTVLVPGHGPLTVDLVCVGGIFAMVSADQINSGLELNNRGFLNALGMSIIDAANAQLSIRHPTRPDVTTVDVTEFYAAEPGRTDRGRSVVIYGEAHIDRSPCGTGTAAKLTLMHHRGRIGLNEPFINVSPLGTEFSARLVKTVSIEGREAVVVEIEGDAQITGVHEFVLDSRDPFPEGFLL